MHKLIALLSMLVDSLRLFLLIELQIYQQQINIIIYSQDKSVRDFELFKWQTDTQKSEAIKSAINWLLKYAINSLTERNLNEDQTKSLISKIN